MADVVHMNQQARRVGRPFVKGQSGNPAGRQKGTRNRTTVAVEELLDGEAEAITRKAIELALGGDTVALRLVMERIVPLRRGRPVRFEFPELEQASDVSKALGNLLIASSREELTPDEAATLAGIVEAKRKAIETVQMEARLASVEKLLADQKVKR